MKQQILIGLCTLDFIVLFYLLILLRRIIKQSKTIRPEVLPPEPKKNKISKRKKRVQISKAAREEIVRLNLIGRSGTSIAREFNISHSTVCRIIRENKRGQ